jgi:small subunit ribosomal protein S11
VTMTDPTGEVIAWSSSGHLGFKGSRKGTPFAAQVAAEDAAKKSMELGLRSVDLFLKGPGAGREPAVRALALAGIRVATMRDTTPMPHNGCRPPKRRRI